jgi:HK97 family phage major capsid protein
MSRLSELQEKRNSLAAKIREIGNRHGEDGFSAEDQAAWLQVNNEFDVVTAEMEKIRAGEEVASRLQSLEEDERRIINRIPRQSTHSRRLERENSLLAGLTLHQRGDIALQGWCRNAYGMPATDRQLEAMQQFGIRENQAVLDMGGYTTGEYRAMQRYWQEYHPSVAMQRYQAATMTTTGSAGADGGKTIPAETFLQRLEINMLAFGGVRQVAETIVTDTGNSLVWPTVDDTAQSAAKVAEGASRDASGAGTTNPTFAQVTWSAYMYNSGTAIVSDELLEDSAFELGGVLGELLGVRLARGTNTAFTTGDGSGDPHGITLGAGTGVTAASTTAITADEIISLVHSVDPAYRNMGRPGFMGHDNTILAIRLLKEATTNAYIWQPGLQMGVPDRLLSYPVYFNQAMDSSLAATDVALLFGDLSRYKIRRVRGVRFYRLNELYRATGNTGFVALVREDGKILDAGTDPIKKLVMHA